MWHMKHESFTYWKKNTSNRVKKKKISTLNVQTVKWSNNGVSIHAFNKSGHHLEFSMNDVIRGKIIHMAKMATKDESSVDIDFAVCSYKKGMFLLYIKRNIFFIRCLYGYVIITLKFSYEDIPGSMKKRANKSWFECKKKVRIKVLA